MKLNYIKLENFRAYYGKQELSFTTDEYQHITVIHGANGAGKTSLFIALNWCLYGSESVQRKFGDIGKLENRKALLKDGGAETSVEIGFTDRGTEYHAKRKTPAKSKPSFFLQRTNNWGSKREFHDEEASERIKSIIPENVSVHFFFDGEQIYNFTKPENEEEIKNAVRNVLRIEQVSRGEKHLRDIAGEYRREFRRNTKGNSNLEKLFKEMEKIDKERDKLFNSIGKNEKEIDDAKKLIAEIDVELKAIESSRELAQERDDLEQELKKLKEEKEATQKKLRPLANQGFIPLAKPVIDKSLEILKENEIPSGIPKSLINQLLEQAKCLCGHPIKDDSTEHRNILDLLNKAVSSESGYMVGATEQNLKRMLKVEVEDIPRQLRSNVNAVGESESKIENKEDRLEEIKEKLGNFDNNEVSKLETARAGHESGIRNLEADTNRNKGRIVEINKRIDQLNKEIDKEEDLDDKAKKVEPLYKLANDAASAMAEIYELYAEDMREQIQKEVGPIFRNLISEADHFETISLTKDYQLKVCDHSEADILPEMSAGQRQVLSLSFIGALANLAVTQTIPNMENEPFPIVMDTPFGRLSSEHRENIAEVFPEIADQLVLFVTDEELHGRARAKLEDRIGAEYRLQFTKKDKKTTSTTIEPLL